jgi:hypothetical protein
MASIFQRLKIPTSISTVSTGLFNSLMDYFDKGISGIFFTTPIRYSTSYGITANPNGGQAHATRLLSEINNVDIVSTNGDSVKLMTALPGYSITVKNNGLKNLLVYPYELDKIDEELADVPITMLPEETRVFKSISDSRWESMPNSLQTITYVLSGNSLPTTPSVYDLKLASTFAILTDGAITISNPQLIIPYGRSGEASLTPTTGITFINGSDAGLSASAVTDSNTLFNELVVLTGYTFGAVNLETVNVGYGAGTFMSGVYIGSTSIVTSASQTIKLVGDGDYIFISQGAMTFGASTTIELTHGAQASRVYWVSVGAITTGAVNILKGNFITSAAINIGATNDIEGRLLSTLTSEITIDGIATNIYLP